jgi:hypothetical protein
MRVMVCVRVDKDTDFNAPPTPGQLAAFAAMDGFNDELVKAGVFVAAAGLKAGSDAKCVVVEGDERTVIDGPFAEIKEMLAGFSIWEVKDMDEALDRAKRSPNCGPGRSVVELRPFMEAEDLGDYISDEEREMGRRDGERGKLGVA